VEAFTLRALWPFERSFSDAPLSPVLKNKLAHVATALFRHELKIFAYTLHHQLFSLDHPMVSISCSQIRCACSNVFVVKCIVIVEMPVSFKMLACHAMPHTEHIASSFRKLHAGASVLCSLLARRIHCSSNPNEPFRLMCVQLIPIPHKKNWRRA
jgi:hypothetical protein